MSDELWTPVRPISELPEDISLVFAEEAEFRLEELLRNRPEVVGYIKPPTENYDAWPDHGKAMVGRNPWWYSALYHAFFEDWETLRKKGTGIKDAERRSMVRKNHRQERQTELDRVYNRHSGKEWNWDEFSHYFERRHSENALERIAMKEDRRFIGHKIGFVPYAGRYDTIYRDMIKGILTEGYAIRESRRLLDRQFPKERIRAFFGLRSLTDEEYLDRFGALPKERRYSEDDSEFGALPEEIPYTEDDLSDIPF